MLLDLTEEEAVMCLVALEARAAEFVGCAINKDSERVEMSESQRQGWGRWKAVADRMAVQMEAPNVRDDLSLNAGAAGASKDDAK